MCDYNDPNVSHNVIKTLNLKDKVCKYCGWNVDEPDLEVCPFFIKIVGRIIEKKVCYILCLNMLSPFGKSFNFYLFSFVHVCINEYSDGYLQSQTDKHSKPLQKV
jgi:hypothetical protein